ncbi:MAG: tandem-95 repeat protein [Alphaproteobacteria bacterium]|nr:tandem-95 repeat protein [Alphaproteobacteria bacterium]MBU4049670.1 tandem-95 repeat protein [Alphaproteobacteria bacterium]MBU4090966.1 tandem-95 repeat protein [Alphaproteobacteria bacterium]MBU4154977.1 tandem-95 repeat protein [Alphaproteobacteria bacterium]
MPSITFAPMQKIACTILAIWLLVGLSTKSAQAADYYYQVYSGESVRIAENWYGGHMLEYSYPNGFHGALLGALDTYYTPNSGFLGTDMFTYTAYSGTTSDTTVLGTDVVYITVKPKITFSASSLPSGQKGVSYNQTVTASYNAGSSSVTYSVTSGTLPSGLNLDSSTGTISGTPTAAGSWSFAYAVENADGYSSSQSMTVKIAPSAEDKTATVAANSSNNAIGVTVSGGESVTAVSTPSHGSASVSGSTLLYTPAAGYSGLDGFTYTVTDSASGLSDSATVSVTVSPPTLAIAPSSLPNGTARTAYSQVLTATDGTAPYSFAVNAGALPAGLSLTSAGVISGTPTAVGTQSLTVTATDAHGATGSRVYTLTIAIAAPVAGNVSATVAANSTGNPVTLNLSGGAASSITVASVPAHGTATASGTSISYTPTVGYSGTDSFSYTANNATGSSTATVSITVTAPVVAVTPTILSDGTADVAYSETLTASNGTAPYVFSLNSGALPPGLTLSSAGVLSGTPTTDGSYSFVVGVTDRYGAWGAPGYTVDIAIAAPTVGDVSATVAANSSGTPITLNLTGGTASSVTVASAPAHGTATANGTSISYTPTAGYSGADSFTYTATNDTGTSATATVSITVTAPVVSVSPTVLSDGTADVAYSQTLTAGNGTAPYVFSLNSGALPPGLTLSSTGVLSGTPTTEGSYTFVLGVTDRYGAWGAPGYTVNIAIAAPIAGDVSATVAANSGGNPITLDLSGGTPSSVTVASAPAHGTATASGTSISYMPTSGYSGTDSFTYAATNASGTSTTATVTLTVSPPTLALSPSTLPGGTVAVAYGQSLSAVNGTAPYGFAITSGSLPAGLTLTTGGLLSGTPTTEESQSFTVTATDAYGATGSRAYTLAIAIAAPIAGDVGATVAANSRDNPIALTLSGGTAASLSIGTPPTHGTATVTGTAITYTPTAGYSGTDAFTYSAANATGTSATATVSITVSQPSISLTPTGTLTLRQGEAFSQAFAASGGTAPYRYAVVGSLPQRVTLDAAAGTLSGTPAESGRFSVTLTVTDAYGASGTAGLTLQVDDALPVAPSVSAPVTQGLTTTVDLTDGATGGPFTGADLISLSPPTAGTAVIVLGDTADASGPGAIGAAYAAGRYKLRFTASPAFSGTAVATYTLTSAGGTSAPAAIQFQVAARPILSADADLVGLVEAQATAAKRLADAQTDTVADHLKGLRGKACLENSFSVSLTDSADGQAPVGANAGCSPIAGGDLAFWSAGSVSLGDSDGRNGESAFDYATVSLTAGLDYRITDTLIGGLALGYGRDRSDIGDSGTTSLNEAMSATLYGLYQPGGGFFVDGLVGVGLLDFTSLRVTSSTGAEAEADRSGRQVFAAVTGGYDSRYGDLSLSTYGRVTASHSILDSVAESGADWENALLGRQQVDSLTATLGLAIGYEIDLDDLVLTPELTLDFSHDMLDSSETVVTYAEDGWPTDYVIPGSTTDRDRLTVGFGMTLASGRAGTLSGRYTATIDRDGLASQRFNVNLSKAF